MHGNLSITAVLVKALDFYKTLFQALDNYILLQCSEIQLEKGRRLEPKRKEFLHSTMTEGVEHLKADLEKGPQIGNRN